MEDAYNAQHASRQSCSLNVHDPTPLPASAKLANTESSSTSLANQPIVINSVTYAPISSQVPVPAPTSACIVHTTSAYITKVTPDSDVSSLASLDSFTSYLAISGPLKASVDWSTSLCSIDSTMAETSPVPSHTACVLLANVNSMPFLLDLGASAHISPKHSDFKHLHPITHHTIEGFDGSSTTTVGVGDIDLCTGSGHKISLKDVLFVPSCTTHLVSVSAIVILGYHFVTFSPEDCWVSDKSGRVVAHGSLNKHTRLYPLNCDLAQVT